MTYLMTRDFDVLYVSGIKQSQVQTKLLDLIKFDYVLKTISREKTPMSTYDFQF